MRLIAPLLLWALPALAQAPRTLLYLPFDGIADATVAADGYGRGSYAAVQYAPGKVGQAARFGSDLYPCGLMVPGALVLDKARGSLTCWYRTGEPGPHQVLLTDERDGNEPGHLALYLGNGGVGFDQRTTETLHVGAVPRWPAGEWHHLAATWDAAAGLALYLDGKLVNERKATWPPEAMPASRRLHFGGDRNGKYLAQGWLDELRIVDRALTPGEVAQAMAGTLDAPPAPRRQAPPPAAAPPHRTPKLLFYAPFDGDAKAAVAGGKAEPVRSQAAKFAPGLVGQALWADEGTLVAYDAAGNLSKAAGAISLWVAPTKQGLDDNCAWFADEFDTWQQPAQNVNALWLWLWRGAPGQPSLRFDLRPPLTQTSVRQWEPGSWHHVVGCWENGRELSLYVDGQRVARQTEPKATYDGASWTPTAPKTFYLGSYNGRMPARALLDEVRIYDGPLSPEEVAAEGARFLPPLTLDPGRSLYERGLPAPLPLRLYNAGPQPAPAHYQAHVLDPAGAEVAAGPIDVMVPAHGWATATVPLGPEAVKSEGVHTVRLTQVGQVASRLSTSYLVVPPFPAAAGTAEPKPKLTLVDEVDASAELGPERFASTGKSAVVSSPLGAYREAGGARGDRMAWRLKLKHPGAWHVAVVTYPDDKPRACDLIGNSPKFTGNTYDLATGYFCGDECRLTGKLVELPLWFTPREQDLALVFMTLERERPAAVQRIRLYEAEGGLPPAAMPAPPDGGRRLGNYWEDPTICLEHGGLDFSPPEVYRSFERLTDYLRFSGQNFLGYPIAWYYGTMYPSAQESFRPGAGFDRHCVDWVEYALRLCERRGIKFTGELYFCGSYPMRDTWGGQGEEAVWAGADSPKMAMWDGTLPQGTFYFNPPLYNPLHPATRAVLTRYLEEAADRYRGYPALDGLSLLVGQGNCVWFGSLQSGYDDYTVGLFEREAGLKVPADATGPARFSQRFRWLNEHAYERWVAWRCAKLRDLYVDLAQRLRARRPDLKLYLTCYAIDGNNVNPLYNLGTWEPRGRTPERIYREGGFDLSLYRNLPGIVLRKVNYPIDYRFFKAYGGGAEPVAHPVIARDLDLLSEGLGPFAGSNLPATVFHCRYFESDVGKRQPIPGLWWDDHPWRVSQPTASGRSFLESYAHALAELDACSLTYGGYTVTSKGHEDELREWARAYRALPAARFTDIAGMNDPVCAREHRGDRHYLYLVNRLPYPVTARVAFSGQTVPLVDLATGERRQLPFVTARRLPAPRPAGFVSEHTLPVNPGPLPDPKAPPVPVTGCLLEVELPAYGLRSYAVPGEAKVVYAAAEVPEAERAALAARLAEAARRVQAAPAGEVRAQAEARLALARRAVAKGELSRAGYLLDSYPLARLGG